MLNVSNRFLPGLRGTGAVTVATLLLMLATSASAQPRPQGTTQPVVVSPDAFALGDEVMKLPNASTLFSATMVTFKTQGTTAMAALTELGKKTGFDIRPYDQRTRGSNVTVDLKNQPFWYVLREICARGNVNLYNSGGDDERRIQVVPGNWGGGMMRSTASIKGPFFVMLTNLQRINNVEMSKPTETHRTIDIQIQTYVEPKLRVTQMSYQPVVEEAIDENGNSMKPENENDERNNMQSGRGISWYGNMTLPYPTTNPAKRIARLRGHSAATIQMQSEPVEITDPLNAKETTKTVGGKRFAFKSLKKDGEQYIGEFVFYRDGGDQQEFYNSSNRGSNLHLTDAQGREYRFYPNGGNTTPDESTQRFTFNRRARSGPEAAGDPVKLVVEIATATKDISIPFELTDLPMP